MMPSTPIRWILWACGLMFFVSLLMMGNAIHSGRSLKQWKVEDFIALCSLVVSVFGLIPAYYALFIHSRRSKVGKNAEKEDREFMAGKDESRYLESGFPEKFSLKNGTTDNYARGDGIFCHDSELALDGLVSGKYAGKTVGTSGPIVNVYSPSKPPPLERPPRPEHFTGRKGELDKLFSLLIPSQVVCLCGPGGMGKSALMAHAVWKLSEASPDTPPERFPDGIVLCDFYANASCDNALEHIAIAFGEDPRPTPLDGARKALSGRKALLILEGTESADNLSSVLSVMGNCGVIITSRKKEDAWKNRLDLFPLSMEDSLELLKSWGKESVKGGETSRRLCEWVGGLPIAIRLIGQYLSQTGRYEEEYFEYLKDTGLDALHFDSSQHKSLPVLLAQSLKKISSVHGEAGEVLSVIGFLSRDGFSSQVIMETLSLKPSEVMPLLDVFVNYGFLMRREERYEVSHTLVHVFARECMVLSDDRVNRITDYYIRYLEAHSGEGKEGYLMLNRERGHIIRLIDSCYENCKWKRVMDLAFVVKEYLYLSGFWRDWIRVLKKAVDASRNAGDRPSESKFLGNLGRAYREIGAPGKAIGYHEMALTVSLEIGNRKGEGIDLGNLGSDYRDLGYPGKAAEYHKRALQISRETKDRRGEEIDLGNLGSDYRELGDIEKAIEYHEKALAIAREIGHSRDEENQLCNLGIDYRFLKIPEKAIMYFEKALAIAQDIGDRRGERTELGNLGGVLRELGEEKKAIGYHEKAICCLEKALLLSIEIGDRKGQGGVLRDLACVYRQMGKIEMANVCLQKSLAIWEDMKSSEAPVRHAKLSESE